MGLAICGRDYPRFRIAQETSPLRNSPGQGCRDFIGDPGCRRAAWVIVQVRIARGGSMVAMTEDGSEDWQAEPGRSSHTGEAMAQVMKPDIPEAGSFPDARPWPLQPHK